MTEESTTEPDFEWAVVEIMGHRKHAGRCREEERFGTKMVRIDVPTVTWPSPEEVVKQEGAAHPVVTGWTTHWYGGSSIFSYTLTDEESVMRINRPYYSPQRYIAPPDDPDYIDPADEEEEIRF